MTSLPLLKVTEFTHSRAGRILFKDLSFELNSAQAVVLMGPNGSGKTTLLRCLAGIPYNVSNIIKTPNLTQSYVGHLNALKAGMTVGQNLLNQTRAKPEQVAKALESRGLAPFQDRKIQTLSAGQRRQVALTRLSLSGAMLWLVDEPTTHLDDTATAHFWGMLEEHLKAGGAAVLSSHNVVPLPHAQVVRLHG